MAVIRDVMPAFELLQPASAGRCAKTGATARSASLGHGGRARQL